ncbi:MAG TPA: hypothetical protein VFZ65_22900 [Planctomycetota bacterium]|nr:hypothetical protein [Planctomycetota bacterium]
MTRREQDRPARPGLSAECRTFLREVAIPESSLDAAAQRHVVSCAFCAARAEARRRLGSMIAQRPPLPDCLDASTWLERVHDRVVEEAERTMLGRALATAIPAPLADDAGWPEPLLESEVGRRAMVPPPGSPAVWAPIRDSILAEVVRPAPAMGLRASSRWMLGAAAAVLVATVCVVAVSRRPTEVREIAFTDLDTMPHVEFAVVRHGALR